MNASADIIIPRTRLGNSCDFCRKRKIKCDSADVRRDGAPCSNCQINAQPCTHQNTPKPRGLADMDKRMKELEHALRQERKKVQILTERLENSAVAGSSSSSSSASPDSTGPEEPAKDNEYDSIVDDFGRFSLTQQGRYFGPSSNVAYMHKLVQMTPQTPVMDPLSNYWAMHPWESGTILKPPNLIFPPDDLVELLVDCYFRQAFMIPLPPILHEAHFRRDLKSGLHYVDNSFGFVVLGVCAVASRYCDDPRVLLDSEVAGTRSEGSAEPSLSRHSAGWKYFSQVMALPRALFSTPTLHDVQFCCLFTYYALGTSAPQAIWTMVGLGTRYALELGMHRRHQGEKLTLDDEIRKRTFWSLIFVDRYMSLYFGRPSAIRNEDIDVDLPIDCDDEYLEVYFAGGTIPSLTKLAAFIHTMRAIPLLSYASDTIYSSKKNKRTSGIKEEEGVAVIDSMLSAWYSAIPAHLRWNEKTLNGSEWTLPTCTLYILYYNLQIHVHRPFLQMLKSPQSRPSRAICMNAARSMGRMLEKLKRKARTVCFISDMVVFGAGIILVTNIRMRRSAGMPISSADTELHELWRIIWVLHQSMIDFNICGKMIHALKYLTNLPYEMLSCDVVNAYNASPTSPFLIPPSGYVPVSPGTVKLDISALDPAFSGLAPMVFGHTALRGQPPRHILWRKAETGYEYGNDAQATDRDGEYEHEQVWDPQPVGADMSVFQEGDWVNNTQGVDVGEGGGGDSVFADSLAIFGMPFKY
ncbi:hypothetical protein CYLTODRAFT_418918 [Cylindrobasidium torrendii FP15055 ss-10]|uniref:Zn(2)-C6 fungal-type domain-containing protein n=1 Tax=Cylindrobasidium torrendii FP15055 ss-10 TaxID=1314674 RepID=A0A0D7BP59_9AGAR|nr:hypothetical protein CYLTODRAFT_418918 [Cylindrobasidium torrendii FP15055 ss-10]